jgi:uncharacterized protein
MQRGRLHVRWTGGFACAAQITRLGCLEEFEVGDDMRWVAIFDDSEEGESIRKEHAGAHLDYLAANRGKIVIAGGLRPAPGEWYCGGLWVMEVDSRDEAVRLIEGDPYSKLGLRKGYRLLVWGKAPCYEAVAL